MRRRDFITLVGGAAALPLAARAQQRAMPVIGYISGRTAESDASMLVAFRRGLGDIGYAEGRNVAVEYRFADGRYDRLPAQLTDLTQRKVGVIVLAGPAPIDELLQQVRSSPIPIVLITGIDSVRAGERSAWHQFGDERWRGLGPTCPYEEPPLADLAEEDEVRRCDRDGTVNAEYRDLELVAGLDSLGQDDAVWHVEALDRGRGSDSPSG